MFKCTIIDPDFCNGNPIVLPIPRTGVEVERLRKNYARVDVEPIEENCRVVTQATPSYDFQIALQALVHLYGTAKKRGDVGLAKRAEDAVAALVGEQKHLKGDDDKPFGVRGGNGLDKTDNHNHTLHGIGRIK